MGKKLNKKNGMVKGIGSQKIGETVASLAVVVFRAGPVPSVAKDAQGLCRTIHEAFGGHGSSSHIIPYHPICKAIPKKKPQLGIAYEVHFPGPPINPNVQGPHQVQETLHKGFSIAPKTSAMSLADFFWGKSKKLRQFIVILTYFILHFNIANLRVYPVQTHPDGFGWIWLVLGIWGVHEIHTHIIYI